MSDFFGFIGEQSSSIHSDLTKNFDKLFLSNSFKCYFSVDFDLSVHQDDFLFVISLGYLSSCRSNIYSLTDVTCSCATHIAKLYTAHSDKFYELVDGNFSFCIFDKIKKKTILARDKMGSRPIYLCQQKDYFVFSSNQKLIVNVSSIKISLNNETMARYLALKNLEGDDTFFNEIKRLTPFTVLSLNNSRSFEYRKCFFRKGQLSFSNLIEVFASKFNAAITRCLKDNANIGLMFSGGLDSSSVAVGLSEAGCSNIKSFSCNYSHLPESIKNLADETEFQLSVIKKLNLDHSHIELKNISPLQSLKKQFKYFAEPTHFPNLYMFEQVALRAQEKKVEIIFDGQDGDNVISHGLERFREMASAGNIFGFLYELVCYSRFNGLKTRRALMYVLKAIVKHWGVTKHKKINSSILNEDLFKRYLCDGDSNVNIVDSHLDKISSSLHSIALETKYLFFKNYGINVRSPFYDKDLIEFCLNMPSKWKLRSGKTRFILREYLFSMGLPTISSRKNKANLGYGLVENIRKLDLQKMQDEMDELHPFLRDFVSNERVTKYFQEFKSNYKWEDAKLMSLLALYTANHWLKNEINFESRFHKEA